MKASYDSPKHTVQKTKSDKNVKSKKIHQESEPSNHKGGGKIIFVPKKKENLPHKTENDLLTLQKDQRLAQPDQANDSTQLQRKPSETFEMLKASSEFFPNFNQQSNLLEMEGKSLKSTLNPQAQSFEPKVLVKNHLNRLKDRPKVLLKTNDEYEEAQERIVSSSLNLLDLEDNLTPSRKPVAKSSFKSISASPSPILLGLEKGNSKNLYDFSDDFKTSTFSRMGNTYNESLYD